MRSLRHRTVFENPSRCPYVLPLSEALRAYHPDGTFPLAHNADERKKATIMGMFVLRPSYENWANSVSSVHDFISSMYDVKKWAYNFDGIDGGWLISNKNEVDGFRLAMQYGVSDAVLVGTKSVSMEGCDHVVQSADGSEPSVMPGYAWLPYVLAEWPQLKKLDDQLAQKIQEQRVLWQQMGYLSSRKYPAQVLVTESGEHYDGCKDFLESRIFSMVHPEGDPVEVYIITSMIGAEKIRLRSSTYGLGDRIEGMLIVLSPIDAPQQIDYSAIPEVLYSRYGMKLVNHDGGQAVLRKFCQEGLISQFNLTLMRQKSLHGTIENSTLLLPDVSNKALESFDSNTRLFFTHPSGSIPRELEIMSLIEDDNEELIVATLSATSCQDF